MMITVPDVAPPEVRAAASRRRATACRSSAVVLRCGGHHTECLMMLAEAERLERQADALQPRPPRRPARRAA